MQCDLPSTKVCKNLPKATAEDGGEGYPSEGSLGGQISFISSRDRRTSYAATLLFSENA